MSLLPLPHDVLLEILTHCSRLDLWLVAQTGSGLRSTVAALPRYRLPQQLSRGALTVREFEFRAPVSKAIAAPQAVPMATKQMAVDYTAAFGPQGDVLVAARFHSLTRCPLQRLFSGNVLATADALLTGRTFLLSSGGAPAASLRAPAHCRSARHPARPPKPRGASTCGAKIPLIQLSDAGQPVPHSVVADAGAGRTVFMDTEGRAFAYEPPCGFSPLPHPLPGVHYDADREAFWMQTQSATHVVYVVDGLNCEELRSRVVVFELRTGNVVVPCPEYDGCLSLHKEKAFVALSADALVVFPVPRGATAEEDSPVLLTLGLRSRAVQTVALPYFLVSAHTKLCCLGPETYIFYCPPEQRSDGTLGDLGNSDSDSDSGSDSESLSGAEPLLQGRRLTAYRLKEQRLQVALNLRHVYGFFPLRHELLVFTEHSCGLVDLDTGRRFAVRRLPAHLRLSFHTHGPLDFHEGEALQVLLKERSKLWTNDLACLALEV